MKWQTLAAGVLSALVLVACGGGGSPVTVGDSASAIPATDQIQATVNGTQYVANITTNGEGGYWNTPASASNLAFLDAAAPDPSNPTNARIAYLSLSQIPTAVGSYRCDQSNIQVYFYDVVNDDEWRANPETGTCSITVVSVSDTEITGTFTATLSDGGDQTIQVTGGAFRMPNNHENT